MKKWVYFSLLAMGLGVAFLSCKDGMDPAEPDTRMPPHPMIGTYVGDCYFVDRSFNLSNGQWTEYRDTLTGETYVIDSIFNQGDTICAMHTSDFFQYFPLDCSRLTSDTLASSFYYSQYSVMHVWYREDSSLVYTSSAQNPGGPGSTTTTCYYHRIE